MEINKHKPNVGEKLFEEYPKRCEIASYEILENVDHSEDLYLFCCMQTNKRRREIESCS